MAWGLASILLPLALQGQQARELQSRACSAHCIVDNNRTGHACWRTTNTIVRGFDAPSLSLCTPACARPRGHPPLGPPGDGGVYGGPAGRRRRRQGRRQQWQWQRQWERQRRPWQERPRVAARLVSCSRPAAVCVRVCSRVAPAALRQRLCWLCGEKRKGRARRPALARRRPSIASRQYTVWFPRSWVGCWVQLRATTKPVCAMCGGGSGERGGGGAVCRRRREDGRPRQWRGLYFIIRRKGEEVRPSGDASEMGVKRFVALPAAHPVAARLLAETCFAEQAGWPGVCTCTHHVLSCWLAHCAWPWCRAMSSD